MRKWDRPNFMADRRQQRPVTVSRRPGTRSAKRNVRAGRRRARVRHEREAAEWLFVDAREHWGSPERVLCVPLAGGGLPAIVAELSPQSRVDAFFLDLFHAEKAREKLQPLRDRTEVYCQPDPPQGPYDLVFLPTDRRGEAELARDLVQSAHQVLRAGGRLLTSTNNPGDRWLEEVVGRCFGKPRRVAFDSGVVYVADKTGPLKKEKDYTAEFVFRDLDRLLTVITRPGVFCHRRLDAGARALIRSLGPPVGMRLPGHSDVPRPRSGSDETLPGHVPGLVGSEQAVEHPVAGNAGGPAPVDAALVKSASQYCPTPRLQPAHRVLELGCGAGAVSFAAAWRVSEGSVVAVDSNARAVQCTQWGAERNALGNVRAILNADGHLDAFAPFDCVLTNPPYFSDYRIAELFVDTAQRLLAPRGRLHVVTKSADWFVDRCQRSFGTVDVERYGEYFVVVATKPRR
ncbi:MAG: methyltransferase domain-containing protein [Planctomycetota bacterium]|nr:MAG: methyltransferase domain-containing protein [Planctomycetota bacterium]